MSEPQVAIVTGASRLQGIGAAICRELADAGYHIFFTYWSDYDQKMPWGSDREEPGKLTEELKKKGIEVFSMELDLTKEDSPSKVIHRVNETLGPPDVLINNAAYSTQTDYSSLTIPELDLHYMVNIRAVTMLSIEFARIFNKKSGGRIINLSSGQFKGPMPGELAYATTKGAVEAMTITLAAELAPLGITVNAINPGPTDTGWMNGQTKEELASRFPLGRVGLPSDAAKLVKFLASGDAGWITGQILHSEGGFIR